MVLKVDNMDKGLSIRIHGKNRQHVRNMIKDKDILIKRYVDRHDGTVYAYGQTLSKYPIS